MTPIVCPISMSVACVLRQCRQRDMPAVLPQATTGARLPLQTSWTDRIEEHASIVLVESFLATIEWADLDEISSLKCNVDVSSASAWRHLL
ncbi:hypothetical protein Ae201684P_001509 [Aphanomyces euteiches]|nr:hypothetical protein Ae201684P_001509 [Aphanomyces euteiches]